MSRLRFSCAMYIIISSYIKEYCSDGNTYCELAVNQIISLNEFVPISLYEFVLLILTLPKKVNSLLTDEKTKMKGN